MSKLSRYSALLEEAQDREDEARSAFNRYDVDGSGSIDLEEMRFVLADLGKLDGIPSSKVGTFLETEFVKADTDGDGTLSFDEFTSYYNAIERLKEVSNASSGSLDSLRHVYMSFTNFGGGRGAETDLMDGAKWAKFCRETGLQNKKTFTSVQVDLVFSKVKAKGERKIRFEEFKDAVSVVAELKGCTFESLCDTIKTQGGPQSSGTKAEYNKFADPSNFTGAYAANVGVEVRQRAKADPNWKNKLDEVGPSPELARVFEAFCSFGKGKKDQMEGKTWAKMMKDCGLFDKKFTATSADIIFSKAKPKGERVVRIGDFCKALQLVAQEKSASFEDIAEVICTSDGPNSSGTRADAVKFHDDKSMYTGAYAANVGAAKDLKVRQHWKEGRAPPSRDVPGLKQAYGAFCSFAAGDGEHVNVKLWAKLVTDTGLIDRHFNMTSADIIFSKVAEGAKSLGYADFLWMLSLVAEEKGVAYETVAQQVASNGPSSSGTVAEYNKFHDDKSMYTGAYAANVGLDAKVKEVHHWKDGRSNPRSVDGVEHVFDAFCTFAGGKAGAMGVATWNKMLQDTGMYDRRLTSSAADIMFSKVCGAGNKTVGYVDFKWLLDLAAEEKGLSYEDFCERLLRAGGPSNSGTRA